MFEINLCIVLSFKKVQYVWFVRFIRTGTTCLTRQLVISYFAYSLEHSLQSNHRDLSLNFTSFYSNDNVFADARQRLHLVCMVDPVLIHSR